MIIISSLIQKIKRSIQKRKRSRSKKTGIVSFFKSGKKEKRKKLFIPKNLFLFLFLIFLFALVVYWAGSSIVGFWKMDLRLAYRDERDEERAVWEGNDRITIFIFGLDRREGEYAFVDFFSILMIDPGSKSLGLFNVNTDIAVSHNGSKVRIRNLYNTAILEAGEAPVRVVSSEVENLLSVKMNNYVVLDEEGVARISETLGGVYIENDSDFTDEDIPADGGSFTLETGSRRLNGTVFLDFLRADDDGVDFKLHRQLSGLEGILKRSVSYIAFLRMPKLVKVFDEEIRTDLKKDELIQIALSVSKAEQVIGGYTRSASLEKQSDLRGYDIYYPTIDQLDNDIQEVFLDSRVGKEQARVEVFNSTGIKGLASSRARWLQNTGVDVIRVGDCAKVFEKTTVYIREGEYPYTVNAIKSAFEEEVDVLEGEVPDIVCTGDIMVILGKNAEKHL
jgi:anionic cell wall polymer biosynthesis LytR-Cps2A-Psr (LCP) family protein